MLRKYSHPYQMVLFFDPQAAFCQETRLCLLGRKHGSQGAPQIRWVRHSFEWAWLECSFVASYAKRKKKRPYFKLKRWNFISMSTKTLPNEAATLRRVEMKQRFPSLLSMALKDGSSLDFIQPRVLVLWEMAQSFLFLFPDTENVLLSNCTFSLFSWLLELDIYVL